ncbi:MAG: efflux RND transporter periplasmic adaptor subunit [Polaromonas sp.]|uniref:efflux RND transporter periplasmic adaptor subunit n=1 Tax=Polaromonas sp. TaxID=1869339 RepID=UPI0027316119|nr:efflux RND transporter periplasmic adaptor subunit [Polaromonas sp.]MDP2452427.1 efflux RND transporter periplasmic adaptor subunit [Polaromonas sp.]MDP3246818.1 efflux RND transporter periplasmic adaptor subunit [Polaromonas sp.]MDP3753846.1 efflux RND transporter periplasmic adaptor subunit [Polaromonas sp.]
MKPWIKWVVALVLLLLLATAVWGTLSARKKQQQALADTTAAKAQTVVELAATDVFQAKTMELSQGLPVSGSLKAVNSAFVKTRVAGELQGLTVREGDTVKAGQVLARIDASEYQSRMRQAQEQADSAKAQIDIVQRQYDNNQALVNQGFISKTALDASLANLNAAKATHRAALAAAEVAKKSLDDTVLRAPLSGQVAQRLAQPGERLGVDVRVLEIVDLSRLEMEASLSAADALTVRPGQSAVLQIEGSAQTIKATVARINPSAQGGSRSVLVYLGIDNTAAPLGLRQGLFAQGTLGTTRMQALAVPLSAVRTDKPAPYVQVVDNNQVMHKPVEMGQRGSSGADAGNGTLVAVKGLAENAVVIAGAVGALREGTAVRFTQASAGTQPAPATSAKTAP